MSGPAAAYSPRSSGQSVRVSHWFDHSERKHILLVTRVEAELGFKLVWFGWGRPAHKRMVVSDNRSEAKRLNLPALAFDGHHCMKPFDMTLDGQPHPLAVRRVDYLQTPVCKRARYLERLRGVVMPAVTCVAFCNSRIGTMNTDVRCRERRNIRANNSRLRFAPRRSASATGSVPSTRTATSAWSLCPSQRALTSRT